MEREIWNDEGYVNRPFPRHGNTRENLSWFIRTNFKMKIKGQYSTLRIVIDTIEVEDVAMFTMKR